jgi:lipoprotein-anchoring transpeptidase ErfK/SrfK
MRKSILLTLAVAALSMAGAVTADAATKAYWDQATGRWMKVDSGRVSPVSPDSGNTTNMGKVVAYKGGSTIPRKTVDYDGPFHVNTIVIDTSERRLYYIFAEGKALKYGVGVGREGFQWSGVEYISRKAEWPGWTPPPEMIAREKKKGRILPAFMEGGPNNPLGARALYIGGTIYRIHGSNEPWTMGQAVSSGCIRMTNDDVTHLYERVKVGTRVVVLRGDESKARLIALANPPPPEKKPVAVAAANARVKDDDLANIGVLVGVAVAGTIPSGEAVAVTATAIVPAVEAAAPPAPAVAVLPEARIKDDTFVVVVPVAAAVAETDTSTPEVDATAVATAPALPVDDSAKDDGIAVVVVSPSAVTTPLEPEMQDDVVPAEAEANGDALPADPAAKDDGLATDLGGDTVPIEGAPKLGDDKAASNTAVELKTIPN